MIGKDRAFRSLETRARRGDKKDIQSPGLTLSMSSKTSMLSKVTLTHLRHYGPPLSRGTKVYFLVPHNHT